MRGAADQNEAEDLRQTPALLAEWSIASREVDDLASSMDLRYVRVGVGVFALLLSLKLHLLDGVDDFAELDRREGCTAYVVQWGNVAESFKAGTRASLSGVFALANSANYLHLTVTLMPGQETHIAQGILSCNLDDGIAVFEVVLQT
ncbi:hypothetical protein CFAM422_008366 [Trichoderma lentiforme]|uniref:Uncharacterized protein n=1 Tax=Trichoderma lentiforme TaxID=1567552 RepID=A0A9P5CC86_9HYPO|nr:hypothetical protein CFAM422_008366 [Trichoderma lentiforme]